MRIVIDLQGAQGTSRQRGIGRYCLALAQGLARNRGDHEVVIALSGLFPDTIEQIRDEFDGLLPPEYIVVWQAPAPTNASDHANDARRKAAELVRESFLASLSPDYVLALSVFEGLIDNVVTSIGSLNSRVPTAAVLFDLIPLVHRAIYLPSGMVQAWYENKLAQMRNANLLLSISESARQEAIEYLGTDPANIVDISTAANDHFTPAVVDKQTTAKLEHAFGIIKPFVMYTGGIDHRKNIERLIESYSNLPMAIRKVHQLAIVCSVHSADKIRLLQLAKDLGLAEDELILTGYISDEDLLACYRSCKLFVFPSWHEGFGLPILEAMKCGRAVIAGNRSSLPEVVGLADALFDPFSVDDISRKMEQVLSDDNLRARLEKHGLTQAKKFSWDKTAKRAWKALETSQARLASDTSVPTRASRRPRLAYISPIQPSSSGISDYSAELLPELGRHYRIDAIVDRDNVTDPWVLGNAQLRSVAWFRAHAHEFDRILYHFGNSVFHGHMFDLLRDHPGVVVLHDFFLSGIVAHRDGSGEAPGSWARALLDSAGWAAVQHRLKSVDPTDVIWTYPANLQVLQDAIGVIVHGDYSRKLAQKWYGADAAADWQLIPHLRQPLIAPDRDAARSELGLNKGDFVVCSFGMLGPMKMNQRLLSAWLDSPLAEDRRCHLVFVGQNDGGEYGAEIMRTIRSGKSSGRIEVLGWTDAATFRRWLTAADLAVQLRTLSRGETSGTILDCMNAGLATIVNANGSITELPDDSVWMLDDDFADEDLVAALTTLWRNKAQRLSIGSSAAARIRQYHQPHRCADAYADAIEGYYEKAATTEYGLGKALVESGDGLTETDWSNLGLTVARNLPPKPRLKRLLVDVSELVQRDSRSGVQRVVRSILSHWLQTPPAGWLVEPIYAEAGIGGYRHARKFISQFLDISADWSSDEWVEPYAGDVFLGLDLGPTIIPQQKEILTDWRRRGVKVQVVIYDLLPVTMPEYFPEGIPQYHQDWLETIAQFDGVICISRAVADEFHAWLEYYGPQRKRPLAISWFHLGSDTENSVPTRGMPDNAMHTLDLLRAIPTFLVVGTLEPRKGQRQVLAAFEELWEQNIAVNLVLVGKMGWDMEDFAGQLRDHPHAGKQLFWLDSISDEFLDKIYAASTYLIAPSEGEGFGLPLIEASRHGIPILARDIPVFREVAGDAAVYFDDKASPSIISDAVEILLRNLEKVRRPAAIDWQTWAKSADALLALVFDEEPPYLSWQGDDVLRFRGNDARLKYQVGKPYRQCQYSDGRSGFLVYGPFIPLVAGTYQVIAFGSTQHLVGTEFLDVTGNSGGTCYSRIKIGEDGAKWHVNETFSVDRAIKDFEVRVWVDAGSKMSIESIVIKPV